jgi:hypothetical protein
MEGGGSDKDEEAKGVAMLAQPEPKALVNSSKRTHKREEEDEQ